MLIISADKIVDEREMQRKKTKTENNNGGQKL